MSTKCKLCNTNNPYGFISSSGMVEFGFGSNYDWNVYQIDIQDIPIEIGTDFFDECNICDSCFDTILKDKSTIMYSLDTSVGDDMFWLFDTFNAFDDTISHTVGESIDDPIIIVTAQMCDTTVTLPIVPHYLTNIGKVSDSSSFLLCLHPNNTTEPVFELYSSIDDPMHTTYLSQNQRTAHVHEGGPTGNRDIKMDEKFIPVSYVWINKHGEFVFTKPDAEDILLLNHAVCLYKNDIFELNIVEDKFYLKNFQDEVIELESSNGIQCSFNVNFDTEVEGR